MSRLIARSLLPGMALLLVSCSSGMPASPTKASPFGGASAVKITAQAISSGQAIAPPRGCPVATPLVMPFLVTVTPTGGVAIAVTTVTTQFSGTGNITAPPVTLPAPIPTTQFGTALQQSKDPVSFSLGVCRSALPGTVTIVVGTVDTFGVNSTGTVMVAVR